MTNSAMQLLSEIEAFLKRTGMPATNFGLEAVNDGHLVKRLRAGKGLTLSRVDRIREFMARKGAPQLGRSGRQVQASRRVAF